MNFYYSHRILSRSVCLLVGIVFLNLSCESVVEVDIPPHEPVLTGHCMAGNFAFTTSVCAGTSAGFLDDDNPEFITPSNIIIRKNGEILSTNFGIDPFLEGCFEDVNENILGEAESTYTVEIEHPDFNTIRASQIAPHPPIISDVEFEVVGNIDPFKDTRYNRMRVKFTDDPNKEDYYHVHGFLQNKCCPEDFFGIWTWSDNLLLEETFSSQGLIFDDKTFNGNEFVLDLKLDDTYTDQEVHNIYVRFSRITRDRFLYLRSIKAYNDAQNNPFAEPVTVHSNFENGFGIFGLEGVNMFFVE